MKGDGLDPDEVYFKSCNRYFSITMYIFSIFQFFFSFEFNYVTKNRPLLELLIIHSYAVNNAANNLFGPQNTEKDTLYNIDEPTAVKEKCFIEIPDYNEEVNFLDGDKYNQRIENLFKSESVFE